MPPLQFRSAAGPRPGLFGEAGAHARWLAVVVAVVGVAWMLVAETQKRLRLEAESVQVLSVLCSQAVVQDEFLKQVTQRAVSLQRLAQASAQCKPCAESIGEARAASLRERAMLDQIKLYHRNATQVISRLADGSKELERLRVETEQMKQVLEAKRSLLVAARVAIQEEKDRYAQEKERVKRLEAELKACLKQPKQIVQDASGDQTSSSGEVFTAERLSRDTWKSTVAAIQ